MAVFLARHYAAVTDVERRDDAPAAFTWRGRRYVVRAVLDHWWETAAWWVDDAAGGVVGDDERERWRVEAAAAHRFPVVVELGYAWARGVWSLETVMD